MYEEKRREVHISLIKLMSCSARRRRALLLFPFRQTAYADPGPPAMDRVKSKDPIIAFMDPAQCADEDVNTS